MGKKYFKSREQFGVIMSADDLTGKFDNPRTVLVLGRPSKLKKGFTGTFFVY